MPILAAWRTARRRRMTSTTATASSARRSPTSTRAATSRRPTAAARVARAAGARPPVRRGAVLRRGRGRDSRRVRRLVDARRRVVPRIALRRPERAGPRPRRRAPRPYVGRRANAADADRRDPAGVERPLRPARADPVDAAPVARGRVAPRHHVRARTGRLGAGRAGAARRRGVWLRSRRRPRRLARERPLHAVAARRRPPSRARTRGATAGSTPSRPSTLPRAATSCAPSSGGCKAASRFVPRERRRESSRRRSRPACGCPRRRGSSSSRTGRLRRTRSRSPGTRCSDAGRDEYTPAVRQVAIEAVFLLLVLKLPIVYLCAVVWWAVRAEPRPLEPAPVVAPPDPRPARPWRQRGRRPPLLGGPQRSPLQRGGRRARTPAVARAEARR